ncbi:MAG: FecR family protein [Sandaracinus sp.]
MTTDDELRASLREPHDEARARDNWNAIAARRRATPAVPSLGMPRLALGLGALVVAAIILGVLATRGAPGPLLLDDGTIAHGLLVPEELPDRALRLDDGSEIALEDGTRLEILENAGDHVRFWLHEGSAGFDVVPGGPRRWVIESGLVTVEVLGTSFRVTHRPHEVEVSVSRGSVLVRGPTAPGGMQRLHAGDSIVLPMDDESAIAEAPHAQVHDDLVGPEVRHAEEPISEPAPPPTTTGEEATSSSARPTRPSDARTEPELEAAPSAPSAQARLREADTLRGAGRLDEAIMLLASIADDPSAGADRALAAFTLGRIELDRRGHPREAADAFERAIALGLREPLLEDARARRVQALARVDHDAAGRAADDYLAHHPEGRWRAEVEAWAHTP